MATFRALDAAMDAVIGHTYITILLYHADLQEIERLYSSNLDAYPIAGRKDVPDSAWTEKLLIKQECYIGYDANDIKKYFFDHELIHSLGCDAILNVPVVYDSVTLGTVNLVHEEGMKRATQRSRSRLPASQRRRLCKSRGARRLLV